MGCVFSLDMWCSGAAKRMKSRFDLFDPRKGVVSEFSAGHNIVIIRSTLDHRSSIIDRPDNENIKLHCSGADANRNIATNQILYHHILDIPHLLLVYPKLRFRCQ